MRSPLLAPLLLLAFLGPARAQTDEPMLRWDCDPAGRRLTLEMFEPPAVTVSGREAYLFSGATAFEQCKLGRTTWTLLVDLVEYDSGPCEVEPDTIVSLLRDDQLVISSVVVGYNCGHRPVLSAARVSEPSAGADPQIELCTARKYGAGSRCARLRVRRLKEAIDNQTVGRLAKAGSAGAR